MDEIVLKFYDEIFKNQIKNHINSIYWVYKIENSIAKKGENLYRVLRIYFFNRKFDEHNSLMRLYLNINGKSVIQDQFEIVREINNPNVFSFTYKIGLEEEQENVIIEGYIAEGKKKDVSGSPLIGLVDNPKSEPEKVRAILEYSDFSNKDTMEMVPSITEKYWICSCGFLNAIENKNCANCSRSIEEASKIASLDYKKIVLESILNQITVNTVETVEKIRNDYAKKISEKFKIPFEEVYSAIDLNQLIRKQNDQMYQLVTAYTKKHKLDWNVELSFEDNLNKYLSPICNQVVTETKVKELLDIEQLEENYNLVKTKKQKTKKDKKIMRVVYSAAAIVLVACITVVIILSPKKEEEPVIIEEDTFSEGYEKLRNAVLNSGSYSSYKNTYLRNNIRDIYGGDERSSDYMNDFYYCADDEYNYFINISKEVGEPGYIEIYRGNESGMTSISGLLPQEPKDGSYDNYYMEITNISTDDQGYPIAPNYIATSSEIEWFLWEESEPLMEYTINEDDSGITDIHIELKNSEKFTQLYIQKCQEKNSDYEPEEGFSITELTADFYLDGDRVESVEVVQNAPIENEYYNRIDYYDHFLDYGEDIVNIGFLDTLFFNVENDLLSVGDGLYINSLLYGESIYVY